MKKNQIKFHQPTIDELQNEKMNHVFQMLKNQQDGMSALLKKYQPSDSQNLDEYFSHKSKQKKLSAHKNKLQKSEKLISIRNQKPDIYIPLPEIKPMGRKKGHSAMLDNKKNKKWVQTLQVGKNPLRKQLQKIYSQGKKLRQQSNTKQLLPKRHSLRKSQILSSYLQTLPQSPATQAPARLPSSHVPTTHLLIPSKRNSSQNSSQSQQIILTADYQREFRQRMTQQCVEQINYLYFSKNQSIKEWSEKLLGLFQKHDKEIRSLRHKMNYLTHFDQHFFIQDIYKV